ncbi:hypothetical protein [Priestia megaterium]|uniref:hypothetical protein n=1 Tax=Priestia megaterium TaxID=1404 RepID=UPI0011B451E9|nr:hypothetical protein [Priestia megaterium]QDZ88056.1 hypothetical protein D0441_27565 [Priestia megaterium]
MYTLENDLPRQIIIECHHNLSTGDIRNISSMLRSIENLYIALSPIILFKENLVKDKLLERLNEWEVSYRFPSLLETSDLGFKRNRSVSLNRILQEHIEPIAINNISQGSIIIDTIQNAATSSLLIYLLKKVGDGILDPWIKEPLNNKSKKLKEWLHQHIKKDVNDIVEGSKLENSLEDSTSYEAEITERSSTVIVNIHKITNSPLLIEIVDDVIIIKSIREDK